MLIAGAGADTFRLHESALPRPTSLFLAMRIAGAEDEWAEGPLHLAITLIRPDLVEDEMLDAELRMREISPFMQPGLEAAMLLPAQLRWEIREFGLYTLEIFVGTRRAKSIPVMVRAADDLEAA